MGFGEAVLEEQVFREGLHKISSLLEYKLPTIHGTPEIVAQLAPCVRSSLEGMSGVEGLHEAE
jgi:CO/xanthine dehydrogenase Mo-binding subunit